MIAVVGRLIDSDRKSAALQERKSLRVEIVAAVIKRNGHTLGRQLSSLEATQPFSQRQHAVAATFQGFQPLPQNLGLHVQAGSPQVFVVPRDTVVAKNQEP